MEAINGAPSYDYENITKLPNDDYDDADRISIRSDDVQFDKPEEHCTSNVQENKAQYSKNSKTKPEPKPRHSKKATTVLAVTGAAVAQYDVPVNNHHVTADPAEDEYTALDVTHGGAVNNDYQELIVGPPPPPGYAVPTNIPAPTVTLESYTSPFS